MAITTLQIEQQHGWGKLEQRRREARGIGDHVDLEAQVLSHLTEEGADSETIHRETARIRREELEALVFRQLPESV